MRNGRHPGVSRRTVLAALAGAPLAALAQAPRARRRIVLVGFPGMFPGPNGLDEIVKELAKRGIADGRQVEIVRIVIETRADEEKGRGFAYLVPLLEKQVPPARADVLVAYGSIMAGGLQRVTRTIPIVTSVADPVEMGLAQSIAKPGGNVTGLSAGLAETALKTMEFMKALVPRLARVAIFHDARTMAARFAGAYERAARSVGLEPRMFAALETAGFVRALREMPPGSVQAGMVAWSPPDGADAFFREAIARRFPLVGTSEPDAEAGALVAYMSFDPIPIAQRMAEVVEEVLRGGDPAAIPFRYPQGFRLVVNRRTAAALGFTVPPDLLLRADRVIE